MTSPALVQTSAVKKSVDVHVRANELAPRRRLRTLRRWRQAVLLQNVADRPIADLVSEIGERSGDAIVAPASILGGEVDDEPFDLLADRRSTSPSSFLRSVELLRDQTSMPREDGLRLDDRCNLSERSTTKSLTDLREYSTFAVGQLRTTRDLVAENAVLRREVLVPQKQLLVDRAGHVRQQLLPVHRSTGRRTLHDTEHRR